MRDRLVEYFVVAGVEPTGRRGEQGGRSRRSKSPSPVSPVSPFSPFSPISPEGKFSTRVLRRYTNRNHWICALISKALCNS